MHEPPRPWPGPHLLPALRQGLALAATATLTTLAGCAGNMQPPAAALAPTPPAPPTVVAAATATKAPAPLPPSPADATDRAGRQLLVWQDNLRQLPPDQVAALAGRLAAEPATPAGTVHLALAWLHTRTPGDAARALLALDQLLQSTDPAAQPWAGWARLLSTRAGEQKRLEDQAERQAQQLRDSQRRMDQLNDKLEALKAIERSLAPRRKASAP